MVTVGLYLGLLVCIALERLNELRIASRNARLAFARGAVEVGQTHYRAMVLMHALFLPACALEVVLLKRPFPGAVGWGALTAVLVAQVLRISAIRTLGDRWNTRIIVLPEAMPVTGGPYRYMRHPNYAAVILEMAAIPLVHGAWLTAIVFSAANAVVLLVRIRGEEAALGNGWAHAFRDRNRFVPGGRSA